MPCRAAAALRWAPAVGAVHAHASRAPPTTGALAHAPTSCARRRSRRRRRLLPPPLLQTALRSALGAIVTRGAHCRSALRAPASASNRRRRHRCRRRRRRLHLQQHQRRRQQRVLLAIRATVCRTALSRRRYRRPSRSIGAWLDRAKHRCRRWSTSPIGRSCRATRAPPRPPLLPPPPRSTSRTAAVERVLVAPQPARPTTGASEYTPRRRAVLRPSLRRRRPKRWRAANAPSQAALRKPTSAAHRRTQYILLTFFFLFWGCVWTRWRPVTTINIRFQAHQRHRERTARVHRLCHHMRLRLSGRTLPRYARYRGESVALPRALLDSSCSSAWS